MKHCNCTEKIPVYIITISLLLIIYSCSFNHSNLNVKVTKTSSSYKYEASFDRDKMDRVRFYADSFFSPDVIFGEKKEVDKDFILRNGTKVHIESKPGSFKLVYRKNENASLALDEIELFGQGLF